MEVHHIAPGITLYGKYGEIKTGMWLLRHGSECMILEMPEVTEEDAAEPWEQIGTLVEEEDLYLKFITATHAHEEHFNTFPDFYERFPYTPILVHKTFLSDFGDLEVEEIYSATDLEEGELPMKTPSVEIEGVPIFCFDEPVFETHLDGEPLYLIHAPKHSWSDVLVVFRGTIITPGWWIGAGDPNYHGIPAQTVHESITRLQRFVVEKNYTIHSLFSVHANEFLWDINFWDLMEKTRPSNS